MGEAASAASFVEKQLLVLELAQDHMNSPEAVVEKIDKAVKTKNCAELVGLVESLHFEAKGAAAYDYEAASGQYELAKDVSAMANRDGGTIIVGLTTERTAADQQDVVTREDLITSDAFSGPKILGLIDHYVFPRINGLTADWVQISGDGLGLGIVRIPRQSEDVKPFVICKVVAGSERLKEIVVGYARRLDAGSIPHGPKEIQGAMKNGMNPIGTRLASIEQKVNLLLEHATLETTGKEVETAATAKKVLEDRIKQILGE